MICTDIGNLIILYGRRRDLLFNMLQISMVLMTRATEEVIYSLIYPFLMILSYEIRSHFESHTIQKISGKFNT